jgi:hypothetical protein
MDRFSSFASGATSLSAAKWSAATTATENHIHCWVVAATFLTPPLDFYRINHTEPSLRHHGSISIAWLGYDAAVSGEMSRRRRLGSGKNFIFIFLNSTLGDEAVCPVLGSCPAKIREMGFYLLSLRYMVPRHMHMVGKVMFHPLPPICKW